MTKKVINLVELLKATNGKIGIVSHLNPDGDAVGSLLAFYLFLRKVGKEAIPFLKDNVPYFLDFLPGVNEIRKEMTHDLDLIFLIDASEFSRTGFPEPLDKKIIRIDHHISGKIYSNYDLIIPQAPSTTSLIMKIMKKYDSSKIDKDIKTCLYTGLLTDTSSFRHSNSFKWAFKDAYYLVNNGLDVTDIASLVYERKKLKTLQLLAKALSTITVKEQVGIISVRREFLEEFGLDRSETEGFVNYPLSIDEAIVGISMVEVDNQVWRISLRGKNKVNLAKVAETFGGGGHFNAAGCTLKGSEKDVIDSLISTIKKYKIG
ncbi:MAG: bifunctional oligoribonuclease/PAP phosphatase NrnA [bacterium]|nr:bifunctional oligoribonuclease/PAP phosphatase NrnA [bacterium]